MTKLWLAPVGVLEVPVERFHHDFRVMLDQLAEEADGEIAPLLRVRIGDIEKHKSTAREMEPDWNRYTWDAVRVLVERGMLSKKLEDEYDSPATWKLIRGLFGGVDDPAYRLGMLHYVYLLGVAMLTTEEAAPLVLLDGMLADGRHRALAADLMRLPHGPTIEIRENLA